MILHINEYDLEKFVPFLRDIVQSYTQITQVMKKVLYILHRPILGFPPDILFKVERGLYGLLAWAGLQWPPASLENVPRQTSSAQPVFIIHTNILLNYRPRICGVTSLQRDDNLNL